MNRDGKRRSPRRLGVARAPVVRRLVMGMLALWAGLIVLDATLHVGKGETVEALLAPVLIVFAGVGGLLAARRPRNPIGWLLLAVVVLVGASEAARGIYVDADGALRPGGVSRGLVWFDNWVFQVWLGLIGVMVPLIFPDGRLPSRRWRAFMRLSVATVALAALATAFGGATLEWTSEETVANPVKVGGVLGDALNALNVASVPMTGLVHLGALAAVVVRLRRSQGIQRLQMKWFAFAMALLVAGLVTATFASLAGLDVLAVAGWGLFLVSLAFGLPLAIGVAILRYRLYDIDVVIRRALVYGGLTATLGAAYGLLVLTLGLAVGESGLAVAASTLIVAGLFGPLRQRIQSVVDRRFFRRRYDAEVTLALFSGRLRDEIDLDQLGDDLRDVVHRTVQPAHVSLWLREATQ